MISRPFLLTMRNVSDRGYRENQITHFMFNNFFRQSFRLWGNKKKTRAEQATDDNTAHAHCMLRLQTPPPHTHTEYVILIAFLLQQWLPERASMLCYTYIACIVHCSCYVISRTRSFWLLKNKNQLDATYYFIVLLIGSTCFGHYYAHHQELATIMLITTLVVSFLVWCRLDVRCGQAGG